MNHSVGSVDKPMELLQVYSGDFCWDESKYALCDTLIFQDKLCINTKRQHSYKIKQCIWFMVSTAFYDSPAFHLRASECASYHLMSEFYWKWHDIGIMVTQRSSCFGTKGWTALWSFQLTSHSFASTRIYGVPWSLLATQSSVTQCNYTCCRQVLCPHELLWTTSRSWVIKPAIKYITFPL